MGMPDETAERFVHRSDGAVWIGVPVLTRREREIVKLAAEGRTTREIAAALFRSPKTIEHHLQSVYRKLGVSNRVELANAAREIDLTGVIGRGRA